MSALVFGGVLAFFWRTRGFDYVMFDDDINIYRNEFVGALNTKRIAWAFTNIDYVRRYIPFGWLTLCGVIQLGGFHPSNFHLSNALLHALNATLLSNLIVFGLQRISIQGQPSTRLLTAGGVSLWWAVNPLRTEVVAWSSGILYSAATFWLLTAFLFYFFAVSARRWRPLLAASSTLALSISLLTYPVGWPAPFFLLLVEFFRRRFRASPQSEVSLAPGQTLPIRTVVIWSSIVAVVVAVDAWAQLHAPEFWSTHEVASWSNRAAQLPSFFLHYLTVLVWPAGLLPIQDRLPSGGIGGAEYWPAIFLVLSAGTLLVYTLRRASGWWLCCATLGASFLLVSPLCSWPCYPAHRYTYIPALAASVCLAGVVLRHSVAASRTMLCLVLAHTALFLPETNHQLRNWGNTEQLLTSAIIACEKRHLDSTEFSQRLQTFLLYYEGLGDEPTAIKNLTLNGRFVSIASVDLYRIAQMVDIPAGDLRTANLRLIEASRWQKNFWEADVARAFLLLKLRQPSEAMIAFETASSIAGPALPAQTRVNFTAAFNASTSTVR